MKKVLSSILITVVLLANFLAPVSVGWGDENSFSISKNVAAAEVSATLSVKYDYNDKEIEGAVTVSDDVKLFEFNVNENGETIINSFFIVTQIISKDNVVLEEKERELRNPGSTIDFSFSNLISGQPYNIKVFLVQRYIVAGSGERDEKVIRNYSSSFTAKPSGEKDITTVTDFNVEEGGQITGRSSLPHCSIFTGEGFIGCLAQGIYYLIFMPSSVLFALAGTFFDNTFAYSVNDASYRSTFVVQGWNVVRDFCNMFFIFILLYIAFKTILGLGASKTKEMIINVVVIGLLINFSLFATRVIIDASNILARVFYNSNTINITSLGDASSDITDTIANMNKTGVLPLSSALVNKVNPQTLIIKAKDLGEITDKAGQASQQKKEGGVTTGTFIFVTLLASAINIVGLIVFLTVGLIFVVRVVGLWLAMILSPFAFFSYIVPAMQDWGTVGWKKWWPETLKLAFLAPVFIFFLYLILQFLETGLSIGDWASKDGMLNKMIVVFIPFAFIMVLLIKAKDIAVKLSGQMGEGVAKIGASAGGLALGAVTGGAALAMRSTIGKYASNIANDDELKKKAAAGDKTAQRKIRLANATSKASFDARNTMLGKKAEEGLGVNMSPKIIKPAEGGYAGAREREMKRIEERDNLYKASTGEANRQDLAAKEWQDRYNQLMIDTKNKTEADGKVFDENKFKKDYEKGKADIYESKKDASGKVMKDTNGKVIYELSDKFKGNERALSSDEIEKQRMSDNASRIEYGDGYIEKRNKAKDDATKAGKDFDETRWRKEEMAKGEKSEVKRQNLNETQERLVQEYKKKGTPEKAPLGAVEKDRAEKTKEKAEKTLEKSEKELIEIVRNLGDIAKEQKVVGGATKVEQVHIKGYIDTRQEQIIEINTNIEQATAAMKIDPYNRRAKDDLMDSLKAKKALENQIEEAKSLLPNKERYENAKEQQMETIKQQNDKLLNR